MAPPPARLGMAVVVPCFDEDDLGRTLASIWRCEPPGCLVEAHLVFNQPEAATAAQQASHEAGIREARLWAERNASPDFSLAVHDLGALPHKRAGAGFPRKHGMDLAAARLCRAGRPGGIIASLDADTWVEPGYFRALEQAFGQEGADLAVLHFEHRLEEAQGDHRLAMAKYELHQRWLVHQLERVGFAYAFHTLGSAFAVRAEAYVRVGGMPPKSAGEDFYFIQKLAPQGKVVRVGSTTVRPSPRLSGRVVFGTGPSLRKMVENPPPGYATYAPEAFDMARLWFDAADAFWEAPEAALERMPVALRGFLAADGFARDVLKIRGNCASLSSFRKAYTARCNAFAMLRLLNHLHEGVLSRPEIMDALAGAFPQERHAGPVEWLLWFRALQRGC